MPSDDPTAAVDRHAGAATPPLILASASARRRDLLRSAWIDFEVIASETPEHQRPGESPADYARRMARLKARTVAADRRGVSDRRPVLGADTVVVVDEATIGKPRDRADAQRMLRLLAGRTHRVITAFCIVDSDGRELLRSIVTDVTFRPLTDDEIQRYLDRAAWSDKAGAYAVQEHAASMVHAVSGSYTNVVGLPLSETVTALAAVGVGPAGDGASISATDHDHR